MRALSSVLLLGGAICMVSAALDRWLFDVQTLVPMGIAVISFVLSPFAYLVRKRAPTVGMALVFVPLGYPRMIPAALACGATISLATAQQSRTVASCAMQP